MYFTKNDLFTENYFSKLYTNPEKLFKDAGIINIDSNIYLNKE